MSQNPSATLNNTKVQETLLNSQIKKRKRTPYNQENNQSGGNTQVYDTYLNPQKKKTKRKSESVGKNLLQRAPNKRAINQANNQYVKTNQQTINQRNNQSESVGKNLLQRANVLIKSNKKIIDSLKEGNNTTAKNNQFQKKKQG